jgi:hypothetical protein
MTASVVEICNRALGAIGQGAITSLDDQNTAARLCQRFYPQLRDEMLRGHPWNFAMARASLPALTAVPTWGFTLAYQLPTDCLRVWRVGEVYRFAKWKVEGRTIVTDLGAPLSIQYIRQVTDPAEFDPIFVSALAARLAMEITMPIANDRTLRETMMREYQTHLRAARGADGQEGSADRITAETFIEARY